MKKPRKITLLLTLGSIFEYYDFIIYGLMSGYLGPLFFPNENLLLSQLQAFSFFALGYIVRPLGGLIFSIMGDLTNRNKMFIRSNFILAMATITIAVLPNYQQIGISATIILVILRILQASSFAMELPGAISLIQQNTSSPTRSFSFIVSGSAVGAILASASLYILEYNFNREEILNFAWRIPFILGSILCLISALMRRKLPNSFPQNRSALFSDIISEYKNILSSMLIISLPAFLVIMNVFFPSFIPRFYGYSTKEVYLAISVSLIYSAIYAPIFSHLVYKISKFTLLKIIVRAAMFLGFIINFLWLRQEFISLVLGLCIYQTIIASMMVVMFPLMAEVFPSQIRFTLITVCYNVSYSIMAFSSILVTNLTNYWKNSFSLWLILIVLCGVILINISSTSTNVRENKNSS
jgi:MFS family permease